MSNVLDAAYQLVRAYPGGAVSLAPRLGKNPATLSHEVKGAGTAKFGLVDAVSVTELSGDRRILNAFAAACDCMVIPLPVWDEQCDSTTMRNVAVLAREFGELVAMVTDASADGVITGNEMARVQGGWAELVAAGQAMVSQLQAKHDRSLPTITGGGA